MRVLFATEAIPGVVMTKPDGRVSRGSVTFVARVFDPGERVPGGHDAHRMAIWRRSTLSSDGSLRTSAPTFMQSPHGPIPAAVVPKEFLDPLSDDDLLAIEWALE